MPGVPGWGRQFHVCRVPSGISCHDIWQPSARPRRISAGRLPGGQSCRKAAVAMNGRELNRMAAGLPPEADDAVRVSPFYIPASDSVAVSRQRVLKYANCFAVLDDYGNAQASAAAAEGLFFED